MVWNISYLVSESVICGLSRGLKHQLFGQRVKYIRSSSWSETSAIWSDSQSDTAFLMVWNNCQLTGQTIPQTHSQLGTPTRSVWWSCLSHGAHCLKQQSVDWSDNPFDSQSVNQQYRRDQADGRVCYTTRHLMVWNINQLTGQKVPQTLSQPGIPTRSGWWSGLLYYMAPHGLKPQSVHWSGQTILQTVSQSSRNTHTVSLMVWNVTSVSSLVRKIPQAVSQPGHRHGQSDGPKYQSVHRKDNPRGRDSSVVRAPDSWLKGRGFESLLERRENFLLQGRLSVLTLISVSVPPPCYHSST